VANVAVREDGTTRALETKGIFAHKMAAGAIYRAELSHQLEERLGLTSHKVKSWFELDGVPKELQETFSKRREAIEKILEEKGTSGAVASKIANLESREVKQHTARENLFSEWQQIGKEHGWSTDQVTELTQRERIEKDKSNQVRECLDKALENITDRASHFTKREFTRYAAEEAQGRGIPASAVLEGVRTTLDSSQVVQLGVHRGEERYTTKEILALEEKIVEGALSRRNENGHQIGESTVAQVFEKHSYLSEEQRTATRHLTQGAGGVRIVSGLAGTGKSSSLAAAREAWEAEGYQVIGAAPSGKAARELESSSGIQSGTIHRRLGEIERGELSLNSKTIVVIDEAAMVGTKLQARLSEAVNASGAQLILIGDEKQIQSVEAGGAFSYLSEKLGRAEINTIRRQSEGWAREAVYDFAHGKADAALKRYADRGLVSLQATKKDAIETLVSDWKKEGVESPSKNIMLAGTNADVRELNARAQAARFSEGKLGEESVKVNGTRIHQGDRVLFTKNSRRDGVENGSLGTVEKVGAGALYARLDSGQKVRIDLEKYQEVRLGYAITTHKAQGATVNNAYALLGGTMQDRELSYVQASRAKNETRFYIDKSEAGENLSDLVKQMERSREKTLASSLIENKTAQKTAGQEQRPS
jgi:Ti-type conjugative transfer relaxase TraA